MPQIKVENAEIREALEHARDRHEIHKHHASSRPLSDGYEDIGVLAEYAFHRRFNLPMDLKLKPGGDGRVDFVFPSGLTVDVKGAAKPYFLFREVDKEHADVLVLAKVDMEQRTVQLLGWEFEEEMVKEPSKDFGYGVVNHFKPVAKLKSIDDLAMYLGLEET